MNEVGGLVFGGISVTLVCRVLALVLSLLSIGKVFALGNDGACLVSHDGIAGEMVLVEEDQGTSVRRSGGRVWWWGGGRIRDNNRDILGTAPLAKVKVNFVLPVRNVGEISRIIVHLDHSRVVPRDTGGSDGEGEGIGRSGTNRDTGREIHQGCPPDRSIGIFFKNIRVWETQVVGGWCPGSITGVF